MNREELLFVADIYQAMREQAQLPLASCLAGLDTAMELGSFLRRARRSDRGKSMSALGEFSARVTLIVQEAIDSLAAHLVAADDGQDELANLRMSFNSKPELSLESVLNEVAGASCLPVVAPTVRLSSSAGSYVEVLQTTIQTVLAFQIFVFLLNGCIIQLTELKARLKVLRARKPSTDYAQLALRPRQNLPASLIGPIRALAAKAVGAEWARKPGMGGLEQSNLTAVELIRPTRKRRPRPVRQSARATLAASQ